MNVIKRLNAANDKDFKVGDLVEIIEVTDHDIGHKQYCNKANIVSGVIMRVTSVKYKQNYHCNDEDDRIICDKVCEDMCVSLAKIDDRSLITHSCYTKFRKVE